MQLCSQKETEKEEGGTGRSPSLSRQVGNDRLSLVAEGRTVPTPDRARRPTGEIKGIFFLVVVVAGGSKKASMGREIEKGRERDRVDKVKYPAKIRPPLLLEERRANKEAGGKRSRGLSGQPK